MTQKIYRTLQNISQRSCSIWGALVAALLVHLLLALLFKHTPGESQHTVGELPRVSHIVLSEKENVELARWMKNHDPAVMTAVNTQFGYSRVINQQYLRNEPEDLPNLMQPVMPQKITGINQVSTLKISNQGILPGNIHILPPEKAFAPQNKWLKTVILNGEYSEELGRMLSVMFDNSKLQLPPEIAKLPDTQLEAVPGRTVETGSRIIVVQSCGNAALDRKALETLYKYMFKSTGGKLLSGEILFRWRNIKNMEQKL